MSNRANLRRRAGLTQVQLARKTGISAPRICLWERHELELRTEYVERIARAILDQMNRAPAISTPHELVLALRSANLTGTAA